MQSPRIILCRNTPRIKSPLGIKYAKFKGA